MTGELFLAFVLGQNALDANLQRGSEATLDAGLQQGRRVNQAVQQQDYRARNLVVTGDVAGGRGFRGSVGYAADGDFSGRLGSDDSRQFRANAALSSISAISQIPMNDRFGLATGIGAVSVRREFAPLGHGDASAGGLRVPGLERAQSSARSTAIANADRVRLDLATRNSTSGHEYATLFDPMTLKTVPVAGGRKAALVASPFSGLVMVPTDDLVESLSLGLYGSALMRDDLRHGRVSRDRMAKSYLSVTEGSSAARLDGKVQPTGITRANDLPAVDGGGARRNAYDQVANALADRMAKRRGPKPANPTEASTPPSSTMPLAPGEAVKQIRASFGLSKEAPVGAVERITGAHPPERSTAARPSETQPGTAPESSGPKALGTLPQVAGGSDDREGQTGTGMRMFTAEEVALLMAQRDVVDRLDGGTREAVDTLLRSGGDSMRRGRYLSAERAFVSAALVAPDNPLPLVGIANAQLGAGLDVSAAVTLRQLLLNFPEMIGVAYSGELMAPPERLSEIAVRAVESARESIHAADYGVVAAYIGYQLGDRTMIETGLSILGRFDGDAEFAKILRSVWLAPVPPVPEAVPMPGQDPAPATP